MTKKQDDEEMIDVKPSLLERQLQVEAVCSDFMPSLTSSPSKLLMSYIMVVLRLEGVIGDRLEEKDYIMVEEIRQNLVKDKVQFSDVVQTIETLLKGAKS